MDLKIFGRRVAQLRNLKGWTQDRLADEVGVSRQQVQNWEYGLKGTTTKRLLSLCNALGVTPEQFWDSDYTPGDDLFSAGEAHHAPTIDSVLDRGVPEVDERQRTLRCPRCGAHRSSTSITNDGALYCYSCAFPQYNLCSGSERHINPAHARFCGTCGSKTFWAMDADELDRAGVPPLGKDKRSTRSSE